MANSGPLVVGGIAQETAAMFNGLKTNVKIFRRKISKRPLRPRQLVMFGSLTAQHGSS
jgi:hypothetical protein